MPDTTESQNANATPQNNNHIAQDIWKGATRGFFIGAGPYHLSYSLATAIQTKTQLYWRQVFKLAPLTGARTMSREVYRSPIRNTIRRRLAHNPNLPHWFIEFWAGVGTGVVDAVIMNPLDSLRIKSSVTGKTSVQILKEECLPLGKHSLHLPLQGLDQYILRNLLIWPVLLPVGHLVEKRLQSRQSTKPLTWYGLSAAAIIAGYSAGIISNPPEIKRQIIQAGLHWEGYLGRFRSHFQSHLKEELRATRFTKLHCALSAEPQRLSHRIQTGNLMYEDYFRIHQQLRWVDNQMSICTDRFSTLRLQSPQVRREMRMATSAGHIITLFRQTLHEQGARKTFSTTKVFAAAGGRSMLAGVASAFFAGSFVRGTQYVVTYGLNVATRHQHDTQEPGDSPRAPSHR